MKLRATILLLFLIVYIAEWVAVPFYLQAKQVVAATVPPKKCCARKQQTGELPCQQPSKDCNTGSCCPSCPLGYVATLTAEHLPFGQDNTIRKEYSLYRAHYFYTYYATSWKPPNAC
ncbi:MAG: hypothetical protein J7621_27025 [Niastella sp.]|nr:hypothetical protein [Niastella sp.]